MTEKQTKDTGSEPENAGTRRSEAQGLMRFSREMGWALAMALVFIVYVIQAFKIPTGSMENSLLIGDFLLGLKFVYGAPVLPFWHQKLPGLTDPKPGDIIIFKFPGVDKKDYIKRCVAGPGQTIAVEQKDLIVDGTKLVLPPRGKYMSDGLLLDNARQVQAVRRTVGVRGTDTTYLAPGDTAAYDTVFTEERRMVYLDNGDSVACPPGEYCRRDGRVLTAGNRIVDTRLTYFAPLRIPAKGDTLRSDGMPVREFVFMRSLIGQENPRARIRTVVQLYLDGEFANNKLMPWVYDIRRSVSFNDVDWDQIDNWVVMDDVLRHTRERFGDRDVDIRYFIELDGERVDRYVVKKDNYFMMGDNRDNSLDSRYWGYLNRNNIKAKAFILYFSLDDRTPWVLLPLKIRWDRIGKLIRAWDGLPNVS
jgi:signal peptidase I